MKRRNRPVEGAGLGLISHALQSQEKARRVDVRLDVVTDATRAKLDVTVPLPRHMIRSGWKGLLNISFEIRAHGVIEVTSLDGVEVSATESLHLRLAQVLRLSENLGIATEWLLLELAKQNP